MRHLQVHGLISRRIAQCKDDAVNANETLIKHRNPNTHRAKQILIEMTDILTIKIILQVQLGKLKV